MPYCQTHSVKNWSCTDATCSLGPKPGELEVWLASLADLSAESRPLEKLQNLGSHRTSPWPALQEQHQLEKEKPWVKSLYRCEELHKARVARFPSFLAILYLPHCMMDGCHWLSRISDRPWQTYIQQLTSHEASSLGRSESWGLLTPRCWNKSCLGNQYTLPTKHSCTTLGIDTLPTFCYSSLIWLSFRCITMFRLWLAQPAMKEVMWPIVCLNHENAFTRGEMKRLHVTSVFHGAACPLCHKDEIQTLSTRSRAPARVCTQRAVAMV